MKYGIKPNQSSIIIIPPTKDKRIKAIKIDVKNKKITFIEIENYIEFIQRNLNFFKYDKFLLTNEADRDYIIFGIDADSRGFDFFKVRGYEKRIFGNAIIVRLPKHLALDNLKKTKLTIDQAKRLIKFS